MSSTFCQCPTREITVELMKYIRRFQEEIQKRSDSYFLFSVGTDFSIRVFRQQFYCIFHFFHFLNYIFLGHLSVALYSIHIYINLSHAIQYSIQPQNLIKSLLHVLSSPLACKSSIRLPGGFFFSHHISRISSLFLAFSTKNFCFFLIPSITITLILQVPLLLFAGPGKGSEPGRCDICGHNKQRCALKTTISPNRYFSDNQCTHCTHSTAVLKLTRCSYLLKRN